MPTVIAADLRFEVVTERGATVSGHLRGDHSDLVLELDDPGAFAGAKDAPAVESFAETLAERGISVRVVHEGRHLITIGGVVAPWWQRGLTGSRHIRLGSLRGVLTAARSRGRGREQVLPDLSALPPSTLWPPAPTFGRPGQRRVTTTHGYGGAARLLLSRPDVWAGSEETVFWLEDGMRIGSDERCDIRLAGLEPVHAVLRLDDAGEWTVSAVDDAEVRVHGHLGTNHLLRTGTGVRLGEHRLSFFREEYADHGRPYGGRIGGEAGRQRPQAPRPGHGRSDGTA